MSIDPTNLAINVDRLRDEPLKHSEPSSGSTDVGSKEHREFAGVLPFT